MNTLFETVPRDALDFYKGEHLQAKSVADFLQLGNSEVAKLAGVAKSSVRFDHAIPKNMLERLEEIANICNMVAGFFEGDAKKTAMWFRVKNPMLGDISPRDMVRFGRYDKLRRFIVGAIADAHANSRARRDRKEAGATTGRGQSVKTASA